MGLLQRSSFARGWVPDADAVNGPADGLLRMDNCILDELGVVALRAGSAKINGSPFADLDVHSLFTAVLNGSRKRLAGANDAVYVNGVAVSTGLAGSGDIAFGSHLGQILFARGSSTRKYDGTTVRNWGIAMTGAAPTITAVTPDGKSFAACDLAEAPAFSFDEDDGTGATFATGQDGTANGAIVLHPSTTSNRGTITKTYAADTDFTAYDSGGVGRDDDLLELYVYVTEPNNLLAITLMVDVNSASAARFQDDYYVHEFAAGDIQSLTPTKGTPIPPGLTSQGPDRERIRSRLQDEGADDTTVSTLRTDRPVANAGWSKLLVRRGDMTRVGSTSGKDWKTVKAIRLIATTTQATAVQFDTIRIVANPLSGRYKWAYILAYNTGTYVAKSAPSALSAETQMQAQGATVAVPADGSRDSQANEIWVYRMGGVLDAFYRVAVKTGVSGTGAVSIQDSTLSDVDALAVNIKLETDNTVPPSGIIGIEGPYYDRTFALTVNMLYPSRRINPDSFASGQAITIAGTDEVAYWIKKALGGLYIGTSKDIYRLEGTGAELPDGSIDFTKAPLNIDHPPINDAIVQDGNLLIYFAEDGWRAISGAGSTLLTGETSLLYRGQVRHGRGPVATTTGRFRAAISKGQLVTLFPENTETTSTARVARHVPARGGWYYHVYPQAFRCVYREPDGTLLASDAAGTVWQLDTGTDDGGTKIPVTIWTNVDDNNQPYQRKDPWDLRMRLDAGGDTVSIAVHQDGSASAAAAISTTQSGEGIASGSLNTLAACLQLQLRITGSVSTFRLYDVGVAYRERPILSYYIEHNPVTPSTTRRRFSGLNAIIDTLSGDATITPVLDNVAQTPFTVNTATAEGRSLTFPAVVGRDLWARVVKSTGFELYEVTPRVIEELPPVVRGLLPKMNAGYTGVKILSGVRFRACTLGVARTVTVYLDNTALAQTFSVTTGADNPNDVTLAFTEAQTARDIALSFNGDVELYEWSPIVSARQPLGVTAWDSGPIDLGDRDLVWLRRIDMKVRAGAALTITAYMDSAVVATMTLSPAIGTDTVVPVDVPRGTKGRQPRLVVTSTAPFFPYWLKIIERVTGLGTEKPIKTLPVTLGGGAG